MGPDSLQNPPGLVGLRPGSAVTGINGQRIWGSLVRTDIGPSSTPTEMLVALDNTAVSSAELVAMHVQCITVGHRNGIAYPIRFAVGRITQLKRGHCSPIDWRSCREYSTLNASVKEDP